MTRVLAGLAGPSLLLQHLRLSPCRRVTIQKSQSFQSNSSLTAIKQTLNVPEDGCTKLMSIQLSMASCEEVNTLTLTTRIRALANRLMTITSKMKVRKSMI